MPRYGACTQELESVGRSRSCHFVEHICSHGQSTWLLVQCMCLEAYVLRLEIVKRWNFSILNLLYRIRMKSSVVAVITYGIYRWMSKRIWHVPLDEYKNMACTAGRVITNSLRDTPTAAGDL